MRGGGGGVPNHPRMALSLPSIVVLLRTLHACNPTWCVVFDSSIMTPCRQPTRPHRPAVDTAVDTIWFVSGPGRRLLARL